MLVFLPEHFSLRRNMVRARRPIVFVLMYLLMALTSGRADTSSSDLSLTELVRELKVALLHVGEATERQHLLTFENAVLEANTVMKVEGDGKISLWVVEVGGGQNNEFASKVTLTLQPAPPGSPSDVATVRLADALEAAILSGAQAIKAASEGKPPLVADKLEASVHFAVERDSSGKLSVKFLPFEGSLGGGVKIGEIQTVTVTYRK